MSPCRLGGFKFCFRDTLADEIRVHLHVVDLLLNLGDKLMAA